MTSKRYLTKRWQTPNNSLKYLFDYLGMQVCQLGDDHYRLPRKISSQQKLKIYGIHLFSREPAGWIKRMSEEANDY